jgi:hypothetical protein
MPEMAQIRVLLAKEGDYWVAQCLEYDIGAQARDLTELRQRLMLALEAERRESMQRHGTAFAGIGPAPRDFHERWERRAGPSETTTLPNDPDIDIEFGMAA